MKDIGMGFYLFDFSMKIDLKNQKKEPILRKCLGALDASNTWSYSIRMIIHLEIIHFRFNSLNT